MVDSGKRSQPRTVEYAAAAAAAYLRHQRVLVHSPRCSQTEILSRSCCDARDCRVPTRVAFLGRQDTAVECILRHLCPVLVSRMEVFGFGGARRCRGYGTDRTPASDCCAKPTRAPSTEEAAVGRFECLVKVGRVAFAERDIATFVVVPSRKCATVPHLATAWNSRTDQGNLVVMVGSYKKCSENEETCKWHVSTQSRPHMRIWVRRQSM